MKLKENIERLKTELKVMALALKDKRVSWLARIILVLAVGYALSPIDLIPDFIPVLGFLDDLILVPALFFLASRLIPKELLTEYRERFKKEKVKTRVGFGVALFIGLFWLVIFIALLSWLGRLILAAN